jgi:23S rRNA U2552 (ribose-2'-O)-methylase RlmE/FtsJ
MKTLTNNDYKPGASLRMWRDYFSINNTQIIGCDILEDVLFTDERITTFQVDQNNVESLNSLITKVKKIKEYADIIIDDGSHQEQHMITSYNELWKLLKPKGIYIIEDINSSFIDRIINLNKKS